MSPHADLTDHALAVIDRTLAGDPVPAQDAELAELTLLLADERPRPGDAFAAALDERVAHRFARAPRPAPAAAPAATPAATPESSGPRRGHRPRLRPGRWLYGPGLAGAVGVAVAVAIVGGVGSGPRPLAGNLSGLPQVGSGHRSSAPAGPGTSAGVSSSASTPATAASTTSASAAASAPTGSLQAAGAGNRQVIQGAQLDLSARPSRVDDVARQVFAVVSAQNGVVESSNVTASQGLGGGAEFSLTVPNQNLGSAMAALSRLRGAQVLSRNDVSRDVTGRAGGAGRQLADARALRTALLRKLALATTTTAIDSLRLQIRDANASIASDLATLQGIQAQVANSHIELTITSVTPTPPHAPNTDSGFTLPRAVHDAGRVLVVAAGVCLIALAALVPVGLVAALGLWLAHMVRSRRRERVLDLI